MEFMTEGTVSKLTVVQRLPIQLEDAWEFFSSPKNLVKITPKTMGFKIISGAEREMYPGQIIQYKVNPLPFYQTTWVTEITYVKHKEYFVDEQRFGPYTLWHHKHFFREIEGGVEMIDIVDYKAPFGALGKLLSGGLIKKELSKIFAYRKQTLIELFGEYK